MPLELTHCTFKLLPNSQQTLHCKNPLSTWSQPEQSCECWHCAAIGRVSSYACFHFSQCPCIATVHAHVLLPSLNSDRPIQCDSLSATSLLQPIPAATRNGWLYRVSTFLFLHHGAGRLSHFSLRARTTQFVGVRCWESWIRNEEFVEGPRWIWWVFIVMLKFVCIRFTEVFWLYSSCCTLVRPSENLARDGQDPA